MRLDITEVIPRPHRAVVALRLVNAGSDPLVVERVRIPVPNLAIYEGSDERLVLPDITLTREDDPSQARVRLDKRQMGSRVADAREPWVDNAVVRAFNSVFR